MADGSIIIDSDLNTNGIEQGLTRIQDRVNTVSSRMQKLGGTLTKSVTLPIAAVSTGALVMAKNFDDGMRKVEATMGDKLGKTTKEVEANIGSLREEAQRLGSTTAFSASEAAAGMEKLALAGWDTNQIMAATEPMLNLASAASMDLATAADIVTDTMSAFGLEASEATKTTDIFAKAQSSSNTDVTQLGEAMKYVASSANAAGMDLEQTTAILGKLADSGIKGSSAGTTLNSMLRDLKKNAKDGKVAIGETSVAVYDAQGNMRDMTSILADMEEATKGMTTEQKDAALGQVFMVEAMKGVNVIMETGTDSVKEFEDSLRNSDGTAQKMKDTMEGGIGGALRSLSSALEGLAISFGEVLAPMVKTAAEKITEIAQKFTALPTPIKNIMVVFGLLAAAIGPLLMVIGLIGSGVSSLVALFAPLAGTLTAASGATAGLGATLSGLLAPIAIVVAAVVGLGAIFVAMWKTNEEFRNKVTSVWLAIQTAISTAITIVKDFIMNIWGQVVTWWNENNTMILQAAQNVWSVIQIVIMTALNVILGIFQAVWPVILFLIEGVWQGIKNTIQGAIDVILGIITFFAALFTGNWTALWEATKQIVSGALELLWGLIQLGLAGRILGVIKVFGKMVGSVFTGLGSKMASIWETILLKAMYAWDAIKAATITPVQGMVTKVISLGEDLVLKLMYKWDAIKAGATSKFTAIKDGISNLISSMVSKVTQLAGDLLSKLTSKFNSIKSTATSVFTAIKNAIINPIKDAASKVISKAGEMLSTLTSKFNGVKSAATTAFNNAKNAIMNPIREAASFVKTQVDKIVGFFKGMKISFPKIKMPHFSLSGKFSLKPPSVPKLSVDWYKDGGVFDANTPQLVGMGDNKLHKEAALPLSPKVLGSIGSKIADTMEPGSGGGGDIYYVTIDSKNVKEMNDIVKLVKSLPQTARKGVRTDGY